MKKHFLLLLMALMSMAGYALDISNFNVTIRGTGAFEYNGAAQEPIQLIVQMSNATDPLTEGVDYEVVYYAANGTTEIEIDDIVAAGNYYVAARGIGDNAGSETQKLLFEVAPKTIAVGMNAALPEYEFIYDGEEKEFEDGAITLTWGEGEGAIELEAGDNKDFTIAYESNINAGNADDAEGPKVILTGRGNYKGTLELGFTIDPKDLPANNVEGAYTFVATAPTYTGADVTDLPTITVMDGETELNMNTDFKVLWNNAEVAPKNAGNYVATIVGIGNYTGEIASPMTEGNPDWKFTVAQKALMIYVQDVEKVYDGVDASLEEAELVFNGLVDDNETNEATKALYTAAWDEGVVASKNVDSYAMVPVLVGDAPINYDVTLLNTGSYTITKRPVTVTAQDIQKTYTGAAQIVAPEELVAVVEDAEYDGDELVSESGLITGDDLDGLFEVELKEGVVIKEQANDAYAGAVQVVVDEAAAESNYEILPVAGNVVVGAKELILIAGTFTKEYGYSIDFTKDFTVVNNASMKAADFATTPTFKVTDATGTEYAAGSVLEIGTYTVEITNPEAIVPAGSNYEFTNDADHLFTGELTITQKTLNIEINTVNLNIGDGYEELNRYASTKPYEKVGDDVIDFSYAFTERVSLSEGENPVIQAEQEIDEESGLILNAVTGVVADSYAEGDATHENPLNDNWKYIFNFTMGGIKLGAAQTLYLDPTDAQLAQKIADAAASEEEYAVSFDHLEMNIGEWYAMVLPFDIDPKEMVAAADRYVIFNELNKAGTTDQNFKFTLKFEPIPAGTPFLVKFAANADDAEDAVVDWSEFDFGEEATFEIKDGIEATVTDFVTFDGTYTAFSMQNNKNGENEADLQDRVWWLCDTGYNGKNTWLKPTNKPHTVAPMEAYLIAADGWTTYAPSFTVEDFDGQTTAIKSLSADKINNLNVVADGWYTVGGMKLQGAPTQKGVYINNGKKVVVK